MRRFRYPGGICLPVLLIVVLLAIPMALRAQNLTTTATLTGTVTDSSGAVIAKAKVTVSGVDNGVSRAVTTNATGGYTVTLLPPATYSLNVESAGFKSFQQTGITLLSERVVRMDVQLPIGASTEQVVVTAEAPLVNTGDANLSAEITAQQVVELPLNLRNVFGLAVLNSSVQNSTEGQKVGAGGTSGKADQDISFLNFGGGFFGTSAYLLDGIWDTASDWGAVIYVPSVEATEAFKIQTNSFTAQSGFSTGNVINVETKSGTSNFHGDAFEFYRNSIFDANNYFNNHNGSPKLDFNRKQYGASAGGPVYIPGLYRQRNKTFIFGVYEGLRQSSPVNGTFTVPTDLMRTGDFSQMLGAQLKDSSGNAIVDPLGVPILTGQIYNPFSGRVLPNGQWYRDPIPGNRADLVPGLINSVGAGLIKYYPKASKSGTSSNYFGAAAAPATSDEYIIRVDHNITDSTRMYARWAHKDEQKTNSPSYYDAGYGGNDPGGPGNVRPNNRYSIATGFSHIFNPTTALSANAGFQRWGEGGISQAYPFDMTKAGLPGILNANSPEFPIVNVGGGSSSLGPVQGGFGTGYRNVGSVGADLTKSLPRHDLSFGFMDAVIQNNGNGIPNTTFNFNPGFTSQFVNKATVPGAGVGFASLLLGVADSNNNATSNNFNAAIEKHYWGFYGQDNWKASKSLTLNLGLRYELQQPPTERYNRQAYFDYNAINPISNTVGIAFPGEEVFTGGGNRRGIYGQNLTNIAPRVGFTNQFTQKIVLRGGYGIFYAPQFFNGGPNPGFSQSTPYDASDDGGLTVKTTLSNPFPNGLTAPTGNKLGSLNDVGNSVGNGVPTNRRSPYVQQYSLGLQYAFTANDVVTASYVGNRGTHMLANYVSHTQVNPALVVPGNDLDTKVPNPFFGAIKSSGCGLDAATIQKGHLLQAYPQFCGVNESQAPVGDSFYNALLVDYNHRFHGGLNVLVSYTFSKFIDDVGGTADWAYVGSSGFRNFYNLKMDKSVDGSDIPHSLVVNYIYQLPIGRRGKFATHINRATDAVIGGWQLSGITSMKSGIPLAVSGGGNTNMWGGGQRPDQVKNPNLSKRTIDKWFDTTAFIAPQQFSYGNTAKFLSYLRAPGYQNWDASIQKIWELPEKMHVQGRVDFFNIANHAQFYAPDTGLTDGNFGKITSAFDARSTQFAVKVIW